MTGSDSKDSGVLLEELRSQSKERQRQHEENIQILVALSIFAGYITAFFNDLFDNFALNVVTTALAGIVFIFLLYKLIINSHVANGDLIASEKIDRIFASLYLFSVIGFGLVVVFILSAEQFNISLRSINSEALVGLYTMSLIPLIAIFYIMVGRKKKQTLHAQEDRLREEFPETLERLEEANVLSPQKRQVMTERLIALLEKDRDREPKGFMIGSMLMTEPDSYTSLTKADRSLILSVLERMRRRDKYGGYEEDDLRKIETVIEQAEES